MFIHSVSIQLLLGLKTKVLPHNSPFCNRNHMDVHQEKKDSVCPASSDALAFSHLFFFLEMY